LIPDEVGWTIESGAVVFGFISGWIAGRTTIDLNGGIQENFNLFISEWQNYVENGIPQFNGFNEVDIISNTFLGAWNEGFFRGFRSVNENDAIELCHGDKFVYFECSGRKVFDRFIELVYEENLFG